MTGRRWAIALLVVALANLPVAPDPNTHPSRARLGSRGPVSPPDRPTERLTPPVAARGQSKAWAALPGRLTPPRSARAVRKPRPRPRVRSKAPRRPTLQVGALRFALQQLGKPYRWGAAGPDGWDCSGLVLAAYRRAGGIRLPHHTEAMLTTKAVRRIPARQLRPGDLVWPDPGHVALYLGRGRIIHAASPGQGVRVDPLWSLWAARRIDP